MAKNNTKYIKTLQMLIAKGIRLDSFYMPDDFTMKFSKSEFTKKSTIGRKITLRPIVMDKWCKGDIVVTAKTDACVGKYARMKEQHDLTMITDIDALENIVRKLYTKDEATVLKHVI